MASIHIKKGDQVRVLCGDDRGKTGRVLRVFPKKMTAIVEGCRVVHKHLKPNVDQNNPSGGIIEKEAPINVSNLMVVDPKTNKPTRIARIKDAKGYSVRVSKKSGELIS
jgi:large subunit ribosomal protein L24